MNLTDPRRDKYEHIRVIDGVSYHYCTTCKEFKHEDDFYSNINRPTKKHNRCRYCCRKTTMDDYNSVEYTRKQAYKVLENLGYDTDSEIPIHEQFKIRHYSK